MAAVISAILLDYEARSTNLLSQPTYGKQREPVLRVTGVARALAPPAGVTGAYAASGTQTITVTTANGAYSWTMYVPLTAASQTVAIHAVDTQASSSAADGALTIKGLSSTPVQLTKVQGDNQSAPKRLPPVELRHIDVKPDVVRTATA